MKTVGVIAEFNPFHNGHAFFLQEAKRVTGADACVVVMSGDFVQRGAPAILDKYRRTQAALANGADLVLELPVLYATASAELFARGSVSILNRLGIIDCLCFGSEAVDLSLLADLAGFLASEPPEYQRLLKSSLAEGHTYPQARCGALCHCLPDKAADIRHALSSPNNILALEYLKALKQQHSRMVPVSVRRSDNGYYSEALTPPFASATALRSVIRQHCDHGDLLSLLKDYIPESAGKAFFGENLCPFIMEDDLSLPLHYRLLSLASAGGSFDGYLDVSRELSDRIAKNLFDYRSFSQFANLCKTKEMTQARLNRALLHIFLGITDEHLRTAHACGLTPYARLLGCRKESAPLLTRIKEQSGLRLIAKPAQASGSMNRSAAMCWDLDIAASHLYQMLVTNNYHIPMIHEYRRQVCGLTL